MSDFDFTKPQAPQPASPDGFDFTAAPAAVESSAPFKPANSQFYSPAVAKKLFSTSGRQEEFAAGQKIFEEDEKASKGIFSSKGASRMYYIEQGEVTLSIGGKLLDTIKTGEIFGEMAVISERPRSATATAKTACRVYSMSASDLQSALAQTPEFALMLMSVMFDRIRFVIARLAARKVNIPPRQAVVFDAVLLQQFEAALARPNVVRYQPAAWIMRVGQAGIYMYVVKEGQVAIGIRDKLVEIVNPGGTFGEMALVDQSPRVADAQAHIYTELLAVDRASLLAAVKSQPAFAMVMLKAVVERLRNMNALMG
jgi:CRP/FNR family transcriptional regulator, cyclic AMP receptor protein